MNKEPSENICESEAPQEVAEQSAQEWLAELKAAKASQTQEERREANREYLKSRGRDKVMREKMQKKLKELGGL